MKPRILDLFCGAGGAAHGYQLAGFEVVGVDILPQPHFPGPFIQADALNLDVRFLRSFDAIHASPPCQHATRMRAPGRKQHANLIPATRDILQRAGVPYVIENVEGADLVEPVRLCGSMFGLGTGDHQLRRHRLFEASFPITAPGPCAHRAPVVGVYGGHARCRSAKHGGRGTRDVWPGGHAAACADAMQIDWMSLGEISESIPPAFTRWVGGHLVAHLKSRAVAA